MAVISEQTYIADGSQREFQVNGNILSDSHIGVWVTDNSVVPPVESRIPTADYDVLGSFVLFNTAPANGDDIRLVLTDNGEGVDSPPSDITNISANIADIVTVSDAILSVITNATNIADINTNATNITEILTVSGISNEVVSLFNDKAKLDSLFADKVTLDSLYADKTTLDSIYADLDKLVSLFTDKATLDSLYADKTTLDSLYADKVKLDSIYANMTSIQNAEANAQLALTARNEAEALYDNFDDRYLGAKAVEPTLDNDGNSLTSGAMYFNTVNNKMYIYDAVGLQWIDVSYVPTLLSSLSDVLFGSLTDKDVIQYNSTSGKWENVPNPSYTQAETDTLLNAKANDSEVVHNTGDESIAGVKSFTDTPLDVDNLPITTSKGFKNKIINGLFSISQRGDFTTPIAIFNSAYYFDRFKTVMTGVTATLQDLGNRARLEATSSATGSLGLEQEIEFNNYYKGKTVTLSCKIKSNKSAIVRIYDGVSFTNSTVAHTGGGTDEVIKVTKTLSASATSLYCYIQIDGIAMISGDYIEMTEVQLEEGSVVTSYDYRLNHIEERLCKWYFRRIYGNNGNTFMGLLRPDTSNKFEGVYTFPEMRVAPTITPSGTVDQIDSGTATSITFSQITRTFARIYGDTTLNTANASILTASLSFYIDLNAELS